MNEQLGKMKYVLLARVIWSLIRPIAYEVAKSSDNKMDDSVIQGLDNLFKSF